MGLVYGAVGGHNRAYALEFSDQHRGLRASGERGLDRSKLVVQVLCASLRQRGMKLAQRCSFEERSARMFREHCCLYNDIEVLFRDIEPKFPLALPLPMLEAPNAKV